MEFRFVSLIPTDEIRTTILAADSGLILSLLVALTLLSAVAIGYSIFARRDYERASRKIRRSAELIENLNEGVYRSSLEGRQLYANSSLVELNGYDSLEEMLEGVKDIAKEWYVDPTRRADFHAKLAKDGTITDFVSQIYRHKTREKIWITESARMVCDPKTGQPLFYEGTVREITEQIERRELERKLEKLASNLPGGLFQFIQHGDGSLATPYLSDGFRRLTRIDIDHNEPSLQRYLAHIHPADRRAFIERMRESAQTMSVWNLVFRYRNDRKGSEYRWLELTATPESRGDGGTIWHGHVVDVSQRKKAEEKVRQLAYFDSLTALPNRRVFTERLEQALKLAKRRGEHIGVLFLDLDNFKALNDTHGHELGDLLLQQVAQRIRHCVRASDTVCRFGGDEFVLLIEDLGESAGEAVDNVRAVAEKILQEFARGFDLRGTQHTASPSIGVVVADGEARSPSEIIKSADIAMYEAKKAGRNNYVQFNPSSLRDASQQYQLQNQLRDAIRNNELSLAFQPQVDANRRIVGCEALLRWNHPHFGTLPPASFVPMAEKSGLTGELNEWVLKNAIEYLSRWKDMGPMHELTLSVNVSVQQFTKADFVSDLLGTLQRFAVDPARLTLELTEQVMARDVEEVARQMSRIHDAGGRISLDDFGTGHSSLSQLNQFPFDEIKIDGTFVAELEKQESNRTMVEAILGMANGLGLDTVAEHVGSQSQFDFLKSRGCRRFQGYYHYPPLQEHALIEGVSGETAERRLAAAG